MVKIILIVLLGITSGIVHGQHVMGLDSCINQAYRNFEFQKQLEFTEQITQANISGVKKNYLPTLDLNAMATYQNEQISIPVQIPVPGFEAPEAPLNMNNALLSLRQWIYDGNMTRNQKAIEEASGSVATQEIALQKLDLKNRIMQLYFSVLLQQKQLLILRDKSNTLAERLKEVSAAVESNMLLQSDASVLKAEMLKLEQGITQIEYGIKSSIDGLEQLMGVELPAELELITPEATLVAKVDLNMRPEVQQLSSQIKLLEAQKGMVKSAYLPKIGVFADAGLGLPGYDIFKDEVAPMAKVGINLQWHIFDWNKGSLKKQSIELSQNMMRIQQDRLKHQIGVKSAMEQTNIEKARQLMINDEELLELYSSISKAYASQLNNGTITSSEYVQQLNKEQEARANLELHKLQMHIAIVNYNTLVEGS